MTMGRDFFVERVPEPYRADLDPSRRTRSSALPDVTPAQRTTVQSPRAAPARPRLSAYVTATAVYQNISSRRPSTGAWPYIGWSPAILSIVYCPMASRSLRRPHVLYEGSRNPDRWPSLGASPNARRSNIFHTFPPTAIRQASAKRRDAPRIQLPLQAHDHRRGETHRARSLEVVLRNRWQGRSRHRRQPGGKTETVAFSAAPILRSTSMKPGTLCPRRARIYPVPWG